MEKLQCFCADLHIHTALSPCASDDMTPLNIVRMAKLNHIQILGITDHNSAENAAAVKQAGEEYGVFVIPGMEVQTKEEVHLLCFFEGIEDALNWQEFIYAHLPPLMNNEKFFGRQLLFDSNDNLRAVNSRLLLNSVNLSVKQVVEEIEKRKGLCIPAHVDRMTHGILGHLGFIPQEIDFRCLEISKATNPREFYQRHSALRKYPLIVSSDAHNLEDMCQNRTFFYLKELALQEILYALTNKGGRKVVVL